MNTSQPPAALADSADLALPGGGQGPGELQWLRVVVVAAILVAVYWWIFGAGAWSAVTGHGPSTQQAATSQGRCLQIADEVACALVTVFVSAVVSLCLPALDSRGTRQVSTP